jgi:hypothetical protein
MGSGKKYIRPIYLFCAFETDLLLSFLGHCLNPLWVRFDLPYSRHLESGLYVPYCQSKGWALVNATSRRSLSEIIVQCIRVN